MRIYKSGLICIGIFILTALSSFPAAQAIENSDCLACHDDIKPDVYNASAHGKNLCTSCHTDIAGAPHEIADSRNKESPVYWTNIPKTCAVCHENISKVYERSVHGKAALAGKREAPVCTDCHGEHNIKSHTEPTSSVYPTAISEKTCPRCHASENIITKYRLPGNMVKTYMESYHGLASKGGSTIVANCASCHGVHDILPSSDANSSVNKANLPRTCGKCHPGAGAKLAKGSVHIKPSVTRDIIVFYVTLFYITLIIMTIGGMLIYVGLDYLGRLREHYAKMRSEAVISRWTLNERLQHFILLATFAVLAYTGFALRFSEAWWAFPFTVIKDGSDWRRILHRGTAVVFCLLCAYHAWFLIFTERGRKEFKAFLPKWKDFTDLYKMLKHNLSISKEKPKFERFNFVEKSEYWALIWGSLIMILTGMMLVFNSLMMRYLPKWILDVAATIHFYEAVLATLAILVWHLYFSVFSPEHYPMHWSWITGRITEDERRENDILEDKK